MRQQEQRDLLVYPRYLRTWRQSRARAEMTLEQRALYWELLDHCWEFGSLPTDENALSTIARCQNSREFKRSWPIVRNWFIEKDGRLTHKKVEMERPAILQKMGVRETQHSQAGKNRAHSATRGSNGQFVPSSEATSERSSEHTSEFTSYTTSGSTNGTSGQPAARWQPSPADAGGAGAQITSESPASDQLHARDKHTRTTRRAGPSGLSALYPQPSVGSRPPDEKTRKKKTARKTSAPHSRGKAPVRRSAGNDDDIPAPPQPRIARIVGLHGNRCEVEVEGHGGREIRTMAVAEAEALLAATGGLR